MQTALLQAYMSLMNSIAKLRTITHLVCHIIFKDMKKRDVQVTTATQVIIAEHWESSMASCHKFEAYTHLP